MIEVFAELWTLILGAATLFGYGCIIAGIVLLIFLAIVAIVAIYEKVKR